MGHVVHVPEGEAQRRTALGLLSAGRARFALPPRRPARLRSAERRRVRQVVDKFNDLLVSCYSTAGHTRLLLLHDSRLGEESLRAFFAEVHELYVKVHGPRAQQAPRACAGLEARCPDARLRFRR